MRIICTYVAKLGGKTFHGKITSEKRTKKRTEITVGWFLNRFFLGSFSSGGDNTQFESYFKI